MDRQIFIFQLKNTIKSVNIEMVNKMDIRADKLWLIEHLIKMQDEVLLHRIRAFIENLNKREQEENLGPMSLETFYRRIEESEEALQRGEVITQDELREEIKTWKKT